MKLTTEQRQRNCIVNDIDGDAVQTIANGTVGDVWDSADERLKNQIVSALESGDETEAFTLDGGSYTTRVIIDQD